MEGNQQSTPPAVLRQKQAAKYLSVSLSTFINLVRRNEIPKVQVTENLPVYRVSDLDAFIARKAGESGPSSVSSSVSSRSKTHDNAPRSLTRRTVRPTLKPVQ